MENLNKKVKFIAKGIVLGHLWMGSLGTTGSISIEGDSIEDITEKATELLEKNKLTGTGDFESEVGAMLGVDIITTITVEGKEFKNTEYEEITLGVMTDEEFEALQDAWLMPY